MNTMIYKRNNLLLFTKHNRLVTMLVKLLNGDLLTLDTEVKNDRDIYRHLASALNAPSPLHISFETCDDGTLFAMALPRPLVRIREGVHYLSSTLVTNASEWSWITDCSNETVLKYFLDKVMVGDNDSPYFSYLFGNAYLTQYLLKIPHHLQERYKLAMLCNPNDEVAGVALDLCGGSEKTGQITDRETLDVMIWFARSDRVMSYVLDRYDGLSYTALAGMFRWATTPSIVDRIWDRVPMYRKWTLWNRYCPIGPAGSYKFEKVMEFIRENRETLRIFHCPYWSDESQEAVDLFLDVMERGGDEMPKPFAANRLAADYVMKNITNSKWCRRYRDFLNRNSDDKIVQYLIDHPSLITWPVLAANPNIRACDYVLRHTMMSTATVLKYGHPRLVARWLSERCKISNVSNAPTLPDILRVFAYDEEHDLVIS